ncbi:hypothetical protein OG21DRAFT_1481638 [Imleria badia]|nr:hypothetical protein OG21DRAFT_1481638 [Imleria badia]
MSAAQDSGVDLVAVACVVESSLLLASQWSRILIEYVLPLFKRLNELHPSYQFRLAFVTYGAADTRPLPLLSKRYFAPLSQVTKELCEDPSKFGIGQTNSGSGRGLSALEGLVAAIELFDILMASPNFNANHAPTQSPQKDNRSLVSHLLHIAASLPDNAQRPQLNTLPHLDFLNWDSIPAELRKRKINLSLISLRKIPQFQDLQSAVAGSGAQLPWFNVHAPHTLLLAGFPTPQKIGTKRQTDPLPSDQSPDSKRQKVVADSISKTASASPALSSARIPQNQRAQQPVSSQITQPPSTTVSSQNSSPAQPVQATTSVTATPATVSPVPPLSSGPPPFNNEVLEQVVAPTGLKFRHMMERLQVLESDVKTLDAQIIEAQNTGQTAILPSLQNDQATKTRIKEHIKMLLRQHYQRIHLAKESLNAQATPAASVLPTGSAEAGPSAQSHPPNAPSTSSERPTGPTMDEHKPVVHDSQALAQFWQSRGGTISASSGSNSQAGPSQTQTHPILTPELAAQMQKLMEKKGIRVPSGPSSQTSGTTSHETSVNPNATNNQVNQPLNTNTSAWHGTFSGNFPKLNGQVTNEMQIHVLGLFTSPMPNDARTDTRTDTWPKNFPLNPCKEPLKDLAELSSWLKRHQSRTRVMKFIPNPHAPDGSVNEQKFLALNKSMTEHRMYAYAGWQLPSGKFSYNIFIFPMERSFAGAVFPDGIPDLPGSGNALDVQPSPAEVKPQLLNGLTFPPAFLARMQGLEPAKQKQVLAHIIRVQQQEQLRRQQLQQVQQPHTASGQASSSLGMSMSLNPYTSMPNISAGLHGNVNGPTNAAAYNAGGGTVNYEMLQSFMQRNAEGSPSQGMNMNSG